MASHCTATPPFASGYGSPAHKITTHLRYRGPRYKYRDSHLLQSTIAMSTAVSPLVIATMPQPSNSTISTPLLLQATNDDGAIEPYAKDLEDAASVKTLFECIHDRYAPKDGVNVWTVFGILAEMDFFLEWVLKEKHRSFEDLSRQIEGLISACVEEKSGLIKPLKSINPRDILRLANTVAAIIKHCPNPEETKKRVRTI
jgi:hypothetical protein